jgi:hemolysin activation/secretion protein
MHQPQKGRRLHRRVLVSSLVLAVATPVAHGQSPQDAEELRRRTQQEAEQRLRQQQAPDVRLPQAAAPATDPDALDLPEETPCFSLNHLEVDSAGETAFSWAQPWLDRYAGRCLGRAGIEQILRRLSAKLIAQGYVTTRVGLPEQELAQGILRLQIIPGRIRAIRFAEDDPTASWRSAFPARASDLLNLRDIEQALEQFKRVPSQDANIDIAPGELPGESDIVITLTRSKPLRLAFSADDSGSPANGRYQGSLTASLDNLLGLNDLLSVSLNSDLWNDPPTRSTSGHSVNYSVPWGNWTFQFTDSAWQYRQTAQGANQSFLASGDSQSQELRISRLLFRDQTSKTSAFFRTQTRLQHSAIEHIDIQVQNQRATAAELGLTHRHYLGAAQLDLTLARRQGVGWFGSRKDAPDKPDDVPTYHYKLNTLDVALLVPFRIADLPLRWNSALRLQHSQDLLYTSEYIGIGNRYTVRGFDGEQTLAAAKGGYWRNDLEVPLGSSGQTFYFGLDGGRVGGAGADYLPGKTLFGSAIGMRGAASGGGISFSYDIFAGWALKRPDGFPSSRPAAGFQLFLQY